MTRKTRITRRTFSTSALAAAAALGMPHVARAQAYPSRPVRMILPFAAGGVADVTSRLAADKLGEKLGQRFVVENMPGPGGIAAARAMITAAPDGYTLGLITNGTAISSAIYKQFPFDPGEGSRADLRRSAISSWCSPPTRIRPTRRLADLLKAARAQPGKLNIGTIAVGSTQHLGAELFRSLAKLDIQLIPYKTTPDVIVGTHSQRHPVDDRFLCGDERGAHRQEAAAARDLRHQALGLPAGRAHRSPKPACPATRCCPGTASARRRRRRSRSSTR